MELRHRDRTPPLNVRALAALVGLITALALAPAAAASTPLQVPATQGAPPVGYRLTADTVKQIAARSDKVLSERGRHRRFVPTAYVRRPGTWQVSYFDGKDEVAQVRVDDATGAILEQWTGAQVAWTMARGYPGAFGRSFNSPWIWIPLALLFLAPFVDPRQPWRIVHLDLLVLLGFGVSHVFFNRGEIGASVPLVYPVLAYLLARLLWLGARARPSSGRLLPVVPATWLAIALVVLVPFRIGLNLIDSNVIDVGYAGVIGANHVANGKQLYGKGFSPDVERGDTYGPVNYLAYLPFERALGWDGHWDGLPAAHAAAIAFDLLTLLGLVLLGRRLIPGPRGRELGIALGYAWSTYPYALFVLCSNTNDSLVALLVVGALLALTLSPARRVAPFARAAAVGLGAAAKFAPLALAPLFATGQGGEQRWRRALGFLVALAAVIAVTVLPFVPDGGWRELYDRTVGYQVGRPSPFSIWGQVAGIGWLHTAVKVAAGVLAVAVAIVPRRRGALQIAALAAAVLIAVQLTASYWFYLYIVWFAPLALVAFLAPLAIGDGGDERPHLVPYAERDDAVALPA